MMQDGLHDLPAGKLAAVVTHLEMRAPPETRERPAPSGLHFVPLSADLASYRDLFTRVGGDWLWYSRLKLSDAALGEVLNDPRINLFTLRKDGKDEALLELDFRQSGECELAYFGLTAALIGSGAGRYLMNQAIRLAWEKPISRFHVHTCTLDSPQALPFYIRSGFTPVRQQVEVDDDPRAIGVLPPTAAPQVPKFSA